MKKILMVSLMALMSLTACKKEKTEEVTVQEETRKEETKDDLFTGEPLEEYPEEENAVEKEKPEVKEEYKEVFDKKEEKELINDDGEPIGAKVGILEMDSKDVDYDFLYSWYTSEFLPSGDPAYYIFFTDKPGRGVYANSEGFFVDVLFNEEKDNVDWRDEDYQSYVRNPEDNSVERIK